MVDVFLIHRYRLLTEAIAGSLSGQGEVRFVGSAGNCGDAIHQLRGFERPPRALEADVVVLVDASLGRQEVCETIRELRETFPKLNVLFLGSEQGEEILDFIEAGATGYVSRESSLAEMLVTIEAVSQGRTPCSPKVAASVLARIEELASHQTQRMNGALDPAMQLTPREAEVLQLVAAGLRNKEIAQQLEIKLPTVKNHVHKILDKFQVKRRREAIRMAYEAGLLEDPLPQVSLAAIPSSFNPIR